MSEPICVFGAANIDLVTRVFEPPQLGETVLADGYESFFGGKGANQAVAAARFGADVAFIGAVGDDAYGKQLIKNFADCGVKTDEIQIVDQPTGCAFITLNHEGENSIIVAQGANRLAQVQALPQATYFVTQMEVGFKAVKAGLEMAREQGAVCVVNCAPVPHDLDADAAKDLLELSDYLIVNEIELDAIKNKVNQPDLAQLAARFNVTLIMTLGEKGAASVSPDGTTHNVPAPLVKVQDSTGAGDTFVGNFVACLADGFALEVAMSIAVSAASIACTGQGAQTSMPQRAQLEKHSALAAYF